MDVEASEEEDDFQNLRLPPRARRGREKRRKSKVEFFSSPQIGRVRPGARHRSDAEASARREALKRFTAEKAEKKRR